MGWVSADDQGQRMLVRPRNAGNPWVRYYGWLGGDFGFTKEMIAWDSSTPLEALTYELTPPLMGSGERARSHTISHDDGGSKDAWHVAEGAERARSMEMQTDERE